MTLSDAYLCTPRAWEQEARRQHIEWMGCPEAQTHLAHARRYALCATVIEAQARRIAELEAQISQMPAAIAAQGDSNDK